MYMLSSRLSISEQQECNSHCEFNAPCHIPTSDWRQIADETKLRQREGYPDINSQRWQQPKHKTRRWSKRKFVWCHLSQKKRIVKENRVDDEYHGACNFAIVNGRGEIFFEKKQSTESLSPQQLLCLATHFGKPCLEKSFATWDPFRNHRLC